MVFCFQNCSDLHTVRKNCSSDREKLLKLEAEKEIPKEFAKFLRPLNRTIYLKSETKEQFLKQNAF